MERPCYVECGMGVEMGMAQRSQHVMELTVRERGYR